LRLFCGGENEGSCIDNGQARIDRFAAFPAIKLGAAQALNASSRFCTAARRLVNGFRIDIIADAMDHEYSLLQLRMIVNANANLSQVDFDAA